MALSKKDYEAIAELFVTRTQGYKSPDMWECAASTEARDIARELASLFSDDNPRFDRARFLKACGITEGE